ncbi:RNA recognition motif-containing protein [Toxoplasma gondii FOU]|uniref:RNA recognition motif-containing protein n=3 Tax=Toxoplasma gondii TaxID=5811 RepID=A0A086LAZ8_TOXGO|nr:RNA recognition motif-containing protein [Toxoplasma gondii FOU]PUA91418.1 RNA recognition motif-containing protein [Toxoplasma gondii TgCATBr9]RQX68282.1 RNA recognition motif-containing protein [Toxoplasma gondii CAST]
MGRRRRVFVGAVAGVVVCGALLEGRPRCWESARQPDAVSSAQDIAASSFFPREASAPQANARSFPLSLTLFVSAADSAEKIEKLTTGPAGTQAETETHADKVTKEESEEETADDFENVVVEEDPFAEGNESALEALLSSFRAEKEKNGEKVEKEDLGGHHGAQEDGDPDEKSDGETRESVEDFDEVPVEGESGNFVSGPRKNSLLEKVRRYAIGHMLQAPEMGNVKLPPKDTLTDKDLKASQEKEKRRQKRRQKLAIDRHKEDQKEKFDAEVELAEREAENKKLAHAGRKRICTAAHAPLTICKVRPFLPYFFCFEDRGHPGETFDRVMKRSLKLLVKGKTSPACQARAGKAAFSVKKQGKAKAKKLPGEPGGTEKARELAATAGNQTARLQSAGPPEKEQKRHGKHREKCASTPEADTTVQQGRERGTEQVKDGKRTDKRFILFAGNLPLDTKAEDLKAFFKNKLQPRIVEVRMLTHRETNKPKGCAFVEFDCKEALEIALNYHHRELGGRKINIELSAGGGGNSKRRRDKISKKNAQLRKRRQKKVKAVKKSAEKTKPSGESK